MPVPNRVQKAQAANRRKDRRRAAPHTLQGVCNIPGNTKTDGEKIRFAFNGIFFKKRALVTEPCDQIWDQMCVYAGVDRDEYVEKTPEAIQKADRTSISNRKSTVLQQFIANQCQVSRRWLRTIEGQAWMQRAAVATPAGVPAQFKELNMDIDASATVNWYTTIDRNPHLVRHVFRYLEDYFPGTWWTDESKARYRDMLAEVVKDWGSKIMHEVARGDDDNAISPEQRIKEDEDLKDALWNCDQYTDGIPLQDGDARMAFSRLGARRTDIYNGLVERFREVKVSRARAVSGPASTANGDGDSG